MGTHLSRTKLPVPVTVAKFTSRELIRIAKRVNAKNIRIMEPFYDVYDFNTLKSFVELVVPYLKYKEQAISLLSKEKTWYESCEGFGMIGLGSTFGYILGDIRTPDSPHEERRRAANFFIDNKKQFWIVDCETGRFYQPTLKTTIDLLLM